MNIMRYGMKSLTAVTDGAKSASATIDNASRQSALKGDIAHYTRTIRICTLILVVLAIILAMLLWAIVGLCMRAGLLPYFDIGYSWFDANLFVFFGLS